jgi:hypothetical protein
MSSAFKDPIYLSCNLTCSPADPPIFEPGTAEVLPSESILLPAQKTTSYLDDALTVLGLHTEARTSFIT